MRARYYIDSVYLDMDEGGANREVIPVNGRIPTFSDAMNDIYIRTNRAYMADTIITLSPVDMLVIDERGIRVGTVFENGQWTEVNEIPDAFYSGADFHPEFIVLPEDYTLDDLEYEVVLTGLGDGEFTLIVVSMEEEDVIVDELTDEIKKDAEVTFKIVKSDVVASIEEVSNSSDLIPSFPLLSILMGFFCIYLIRKWFQ